MCMSQYRVDIGGRSGYTGPGSLPAMAARVPSLGGHFFWAIAAGRSRQVVETATGGQLAGLGYRAEPWVEGPVDDSVESLDGQSVLSRALIGRLVTPGALDLTPRGWARVAFVQHIAF
jgi:hypothetical protein